MYPENLKYTPEHEWVQVATEAGGEVTVRFGITDYAQEALGDIVFVTLPSVGAELVAGTACGEIESTKSVSDVYAPVTGVVVTRNEAVETAPETINSDPYGAGWLVEVQVADPSPMEQLLDVAAYRELTTNS
jgi:glycine cleavage system H protein